jgi:transmembrane sensor
MTTSPKYDFPWELISASFTGELSKDEEIQLQQWMAENPENKEKYEQLREIWTSGVEDYALYQKANETSAWNTLVTKLQPEGTKSIHLHTAQQLIYRIAAIAAIFIILFGVGYWYVSSKQSNSITYETASGEQKNVLLPDSTSIALSPATKIEVTKGFNSKNRTVYMASGNASFDVKHRDNLPFVVDLGNVKIKDIGTVFNISKDKNHITIKVISGTVAFSKESTQETKELGAGMSLTYNMQTDHIEEVKDESPAVKTDDVVLNFNDTPLKDVAALIEKKYGKTINLVGDSIAFKRFTAQLEGVKFETVLDVICRSLNLEYSFNNDMVTIHEKNIK